MEQRNMTKRRSPDPIGDNPEHRQGNRCGYTLKADGRIEPAPIYTDQLEKIAAERNGINDLMKLFTSHCANLLAEISRRQRRVWNELCEDYGIDQSTHDITFDGTYITLKPRPTPDSAGATHSE